MLNRIKLITMVVLLACMGQQASAQTMPNESPFGFSLWAAGVSRPLFHNTGTFVSKGPALMVLPEVIHKPTGLYGGVFLVIPTYGEAGREIDIRIGKGFKLGPVDIDISGAWYHFVVEGGKIFDTANGRARLSHTFQVDPTFKITPFFVVDYQKLLGPPHDTFVGLAGGLTFKKSLMGVWGEPTLGVEFSAWKYVETPTVGRDLIVSGLAELMFKIPSTSVSIGPRFLGVYNDIDDSRLFNGYAGGQVRLSF